MHSQPGCRPGDHPLIGRRQLLQVGGLGLIGAGMSDLLRLEAQAAATPNRSAGRAKSVVFIFQAGGPSQHETFDPKPESPSEIRGEYGTTQTKLSGIHFCEYLPKLSSQADKFSIVRTMHHVAGREFRNEHSSCTYMLHTGTTELPIGDTNASIATARPERMAWPNIGSMLAYAAPPDPGIGWPAVVEILRELTRCRYPGRDPGMLGPQYSHWGVDLATEMSRQRRGRIVSRTVTATMIRMILRVLQVLGRTPGGTTPVVAIPISICRTLVRNWGSPSRN